MKKNILLIAVYFCGTFCLAVPLEAAPGAFDLLGITDFTSGSDDEGSAIAAQPGDEKILVGGRTSESGGDSDFALARYSAVELVLDTSFGTGGKVITDLAAGSDDFMISIGIQSNGKIIGGGASGTFPDFAFALVRYNLDGSLDTSFGSSGLVLDNLTPDIDSIETLVILGDDKIVVGGLSGGGVSGSVLARYTADGNSDTSFGTGGTASVPFAIVTDLLIQTDGKIVAVGLSAFGGDFAAARFNADGSPDTAFGSGGTVITPIGIGFSQAQAAGLQSDGRIVVVGSAVISPDDDQFAIVRYTTNGVLDTSFGSGGQVITDFGVTDAEESPEDLDVQADDKIVVVGKATKVFDGNSDFGVMRFNPDGSPDLTFSGDGKVTSDIGSDDDDEPEALLIQAGDINKDTRGKIVVAGKTHIGFDEDADDFALVRFLGDTANLALFKTVDTETPRLGDTIDIGLTVNNGGPEAASGVFLTDTVPSELTFVSGSLSASQGTCSGTVTITCDLGTIDNGGTATVRYNVTVSSLGGASNTAQVEGQAADPDFNNNTDSLTFTITERGGGCQLIR